MPRRGNSATEHIQLSGLGPGDHHEAFRPAGDDIALGNWSLPGWSWAAASAIPMVINTLFYSPIYVERSTTFTRIACHVTNAVVASLVRLGIYAAIIDGDGQLTPGTLVLDAGTVDTASTGQKEIVIAETLAQGYFFLAAEAHLAPSLAAPETGFAVSAPVTSHDGLVNQTSDNTVLTVTVGVDAPALVDPAPTPTGTANMARSFARLRT